MFQFIFRKIISKKWLFLSLLIGNILLIGITASNPMYMNAVTQRMLTDALEDQLEAKNAYPSLLTVNYICDSKAMENLDAPEKLALSLPERYGVPAMVKVRFFRVMQQINEILMKRDKVQNKLIDLCAYEGFEAHAKLLAGRFGASSVREDGVVEVTVHQNALVQMNLLLNEQRKMTNLKDANGNPIVIEVVGVFDIDDPSDAFWIRRPSASATDVYLNFDLFREVFLREGANPAINATWYTLLDYEQMQSKNAASMHEVTQQIKRSLRDDKNYRFACDFDALLSDHISAAHRVTVSVLVLQMPVYVLLAIFIFMVSRQIIQSEESEIAVLKSRGVHNGQVLLIYLTQSTLVAFAALGFGLPMGQLVTRILGSANGFMEFVSRRSLAAHVDGETLLYAVVAAVLSICAMVLPATRFTRASIVTQKQKKARKERPMWQRFFLDFILLGVALYGFYSFNNQKAHLLSQIMAGATPDPLLLLGSSLFIMGAGLLMVRLIPLPVMLVFHVFRRRWSPALYASFLQVIRKRNEQGFMMVFLVMTIALGLFNAQTARSMNSSAEKNARYLAGAEVTFAEEWETSSSPYDGDHEVLWIEPDFKQYFDIEGVESAARVYRSTAATVSITGGSLKNVQLMGIDTDDFGRTAWFDAKLLPLHWYHYLNAMAQNARAVLVSTDFRDTYGCQIGDAITWNLGGNSCRGVIYGFVEYFPGYAPTAYVKGDDGLFKEVPQHLVVANLTQVQSIMGLKPYEIWLRTADDGAGVYKWAQEGTHKFLSYHAIQDQLVEIKRETLLLSLNGVLTVSFIVALVLCFIGFLIYWILSIKQRTLLFGIYRAMGLTVRELGSLLANEQICISLTSIAAGFGVGLLASRLYMSMVRMAFMSSDSILPLETLIDRGDVISLLAMIGVMMLICMAILIVMIGRMKIGQALKLGED